MNGPSVLKRFIIRAAAFSIWFLIIAGIMSLLHVPGAFVWGLMGAMVLTKKMLSVML